MRCRFSRWRASQSLSKGHPRISRMVRWFEVLLPLRLNDGTAVPDNAIADTFLELEQQFGAVSCNTKTVRGQWRHEGKSYRDDLVQVYVDTDDEPKSRQYNRDILAFTQRSTIRPRNLECPLHLSINRPGVMGPSRRHNHDHRYACSASWSSRSSSSVGWDVIPLREEWYADPHNMP